ncbi:unnamed protein product, partial [Ectocarpus fasciculatus]
QASPCPRLRGGTEADPHFRQHRGGLRAQGRQPRPVCAQAIPGGVHLQERLGQGSVLGHGRRLPQRARTQGRRGPRGRLQHRGFHPPVPFCR